MRLAAVWAIRLWQETGTVFQQARMNKVMVVTQGHNVPAQRLYQRHGYRTTKTSLWLHRWLSPK